MRPNIFNISKEVDADECGIDDNLDNLEKVLWKGDIGRKDLWGGNVAIYFYYDAWRGSVYASTEPFTFKDACDIDAMFEEGAIIPEEEEIPTKRRLWLVKK